MVSCPFLPLKSIWGALRKPRVLQELLRELVHDAHTLGLKVVLDVLLGLLGKDEGLDWAGKG